MVRPGPSAVGTRRMTRCPHCNAETPPGVPACPQCQLDFADDEYDDVLTMRTRPKLLVLRKAAKSAETVAARASDQGTTETADPPVTPTTPTPAQPRLRVMRGLRVHA